MVEPEVIQIKDIGGLTDMIAQLHGLPVGFDTETTGVEPLNHHLRLLQFSDGEKAWVIDCWDDWFQEPMAGITLTEWMENGDNILIAHNAKFDLAFLRYRLNIEPRPDHVFDTMHAASLLGYPWSLEHLASYLLAEDLPKDQQQGGWDADELPDEKIEYAARDAAVLIPLHKRLQSDLAMNRLAAVAHIENTATPALAEIELVGFKLDRRRWHKLRLEHEEKRAAAEDEFNFHIPEDPNSTMMLPIGDEYAPRINLNSPNQIKEAFARLGVELENTQKGTLKALKTPAAEALLRVKLHEKLLNTYLRKYGEHVHPHTSRIHPNIWQLRVKTGRLSMSSPNLQQVPVRGTNEFRRCFVAGQDKAIVTADYSQIELRILAELSGDEELAVAFRNGTDIHSKTAAMMFEKEPHMVTDDERAAGKTMNFALVYGQGVGATAAQMGVSQQEAKDRMRKFFEAMPSVRDWIREQKKHGTRHQYVYTLAGRRIMPEPEEGRAERTAVNYPIQGSSADITKSALGKLYVAFKNGWKDDPWSRPHLVHTVHDEIVVECDWEQKDRVAGMVEKIMVEAGCDLITSVPVVVDVHTGEEWSK